MEIQPLIKKGKVWKGRSWTLVMLSLKWPRMLVGERQHKPLRALHDKDGIRTHACRAQWISSPLPDGNTVTHPEREGMEGKELDTGYGVTKSVSYARFGKKTQALEGPSRRGWDSNPRVQSTID